MTRPVRILLGAISVAIEVGVSIAVFKGKAWHILPVLWLLGLIPFALAFRRPSSSPRAFRLAGAGAILFAILLPVAVRVANFDRNRLHTDEFITCYFSATHDFQNESFFGAMPARWQWLGQFPTLHFFLQRLFFDVFGANLFTMRLSIQLYVAVVSLMLFFIVRDLCDTVTALAAVVLNAFLAISVYLETYGLMFVSSTAVFLCFFYFAYKQFRTREVYAAALTGLCCGACYLFYYSSYLALPLLFVMFTIQLLRDRSARTLANLGIVLLGTALTVGPFLAEGLRTKELLTGRAKQVSLLNGDWSSHREEIEKGANPWPILKESVQLGLRSMHEDGVGGHGGYDFGHLAMLEKSTRILFLIGAALCVPLMFRRAGFFFVLVAIAAAFVSGIALTIPPPAYHRFSVAFPFLALVMAVPFYVLRKIPGIPPTVSLSLTAGILLLVACLGQRRVMEAACRDAPVTELRLSEFINQRYPGRPLYIAAFPGYAFYCIYYFGGPESHRRPLILTEYHDKLIASLKRDEKYVYVMILGQYFTEQFQAADPKGKLFKFSPAVTIFAN